MLQPDCSPSVLALPWWGKDSLRAIQLLLGPFGTRRLLIGTGRDGGDM